MVESQLLPDAARIVVIGGGVGGASVAYHLAELGERDVVLLERADLTSGSTFHSAGLVGILRADPTLTRMNRYSAELYARLQQTEHPPGWVPCGGLKLASSPERLAEIRRQASWARSYDLALVEISAAEAMDLFPLMNPDGVLAAAWLPGDGYVDPSQLCLSLIHGARAGGVSVHTRTRVLGIDTVAVSSSGGSASLRRVSKVRTDRGDIDCEIVVDCGGMFAAEIARMVGVRVPIIPIEHQYLITEGFRAATDAGLPTLRDPDWLVYWRQEVDGLLMGGYERDPAPWSVSSTRYDAVPGDFNGRLLAEDWPRFESIAENSRVRVPITTEVGIRKLVNGPEAFTPDNEFCLGESEVRGFFVAAGFCAHGIAGAGGIGKVMAEWIVSGDPGLDVWHMDLRRFGPAYDSPSFALARAVESYATYYDVAYPGRERTSGRPLRTSPVYPWHAAAGQDAEFGEKAGWERVNWYRANESHEFALGAVRPQGWAGRQWSPAIAAEHRAARERAALFDQTSFAKLSVTGPGAASLLEWVCDNRVSRSVGAVTYTQLLNARGGIEADVTVTRLAENEFLVVTGTAFGLHDASWLRRQADARDAAVQVRDVTGQYVCFGLWGPLTRSILAPLTPADLSTAAFPYLTSQWTTLGDVPVRMARVTFVGEFGYELYASTEYGAALWNLLWAAGRPAGLVAAGYRAIDSLRLEKGYRVWAGDLTPETTPDEAGLSFCVKLNKPGGFLGAEALRQARAATSASHGPRRLACLTMVDPRNVAIGGEPVRAGARVLGRVTSAGFGYTTGASIAYAYLPLADAAPGIPLQVDLFGTWADAVTTPATLYDPTSARLRA